MQVNGNNNLDEESQSSKIGEKSSVKLAPNTFYITLRDVFIGSISTLKRWLNLSTGILLSHLRSNFYALLGVLAPTAAIEKHRISAQNTGKKLIPSSLLPLSIAIGQQPDLLFLNEPLRLAIPSGATTRKHVICDPEQTELHQLDFTPVDQLDLLCSPPNIDSQERRNSTSDSLSLGCYSSTSSSFFHDNQHYFHRNDDHQFACSHCNWLMDSHRRRQAFSSQRLASDPKQELAALAGGASSAGGGSYCRRPSDVSEQRPADESAVFCTDCFEGSSGRNSMAATPPSASGAGSSTTATMQSGASMGSSARALLKVLEHEPSEESASRQRHQQRLWQCNERLLRMKAQGQHQLEQQQQQRQQQQQPPKRHSCNSEDIISSSLRSMQFAQEQRQHKGPSKHKPTRGRGRDDLLPEAATGGGQSGGDYPICSAAAAAPVASTSSSSSNSSIASLVEAALQQRPQNTKHPQNPHHHHCHRQQQQNSQLNGAMSSSSVSRRTIAGTGGGGPSKTSAATRDNHNEDEDDVNDNDGHAEVLVSKGALSALTDQIALSLSKMRDLEDQVRVIPELQRRLDHVLNSHQPASSNKPAARDCNYFGQPYFGYNPLLLDDEAGNSSDQREDERQAQQQRRQRRRHFGAAAAARAADNGDTSSPDAMHGNQNQQQQQQLGNNTSTATGGRHIIMTNGPTCGSANAAHSQRNPKDRELDRQAPLDCGCQSIREHLKYNTISREQRLNSSSRSQSNSVTSTARNFVVSPQFQVPLQQATTATVASSSSLSSRSVVLSKSDASTNTDLFMGDIVSRSELDELLKRIQPVAQIAPFKFEQPLGGIQSKADIKLQSSHESSPTSEVRCSDDQSSATTTEPKSSSPVNTLSEDTGEDEPITNHNELKSDSVLMDQNSMREKDDATSISQDITYVVHKGDHDEDDDDEGESNTGSTNGEGPYSLGSSYQDPSDFEEYCAYGESLDRRTKDFMSQSTKIPSDLRFALIRFNDFIKRNRTVDQIQSSSGCVEVIRKEWFAVSANKDSQASNTKLYVDYFESFTKQLLNTVVNLTDSAGNTAMHYAASHYKMDVIEVLLSTKVCDVNCRNKAGYTPIMLLALADICDPKEQEIARNLFTMGDVNIKDRTSGQTALMLASSHGRVSTCKLLLESGADPSLQDCDGSTALMCGSEIGNEEIVRCLLAHKLTDPAAKDNDGLDALTIAMKNGHKSVGLILYAANNVPRMARPMPNGLSRSAYSNIPSIYVGASLRRNRGKLATNYVRRSDSLVGARNGRPLRQSGA